ncbi:MAG: DUF5331 domain-containing protein [Gloeotrichia echinulata IR180]|jgi:hypothetical protein|nr:DUF5331 domain-containing protein [Gloeotrichia echinulata DEX184]
MNIQQLRQSLKLKWLSYYKQNRSWLVKMQIWGTYDGLRRPLSGFILATLSILEPQLDEILLFLMDLSNNPDKIVAALGLNFNPDEELSLIESQDSTNVNPVKSEYPEDKYIEDISLPLIEVATRVTSEPPDETLHPKQLPVGFQPISKPASSVTLTHGWLRDIGSGLRHRKPVPSVAVTIQENRQSPANTILLEKPRTEILHQLKPLRSPALLTELPSQTKTLPSLALTIKISSNGKPQISLPVANKATKKSKSVISQPKDIPHKINLSSSTNARSLASWVDEFCHGSE